MRLLTLPVTIVRVPIELGFGAAKQAVKFAHGLVGGGGEEPVAEEPRPAPPPRRRRTSSRSGNGRARTGRASSSRARKTATTRPRPPAPEASTATAPATGPTAPVVTEPAPEADVAAEPPHVSEEPELVAEAAEAGAEEGAGAEVAVDEPWPGYDQMNAADIEDRLVTEGAETAAAVSLYEASRKGRASILEAASRTMTT
jgi:hypothetical protein